MSKQTYKKHVAKTEKAMPSGTGPELASKCASNVVPSLKKLCQRVVAKNNQANLEPKLW